MADLELIARLGFAARALGAAQRAFELALDHAKTRRQFGEPIGKFQAIQHKLANCAISLDGTRLTIENASAVYDLGSQDWRVFASSAFAFASSALRQVSLETHHAFGAIGYSEEHEAPRHFRRVHSDLVRHGGVRRAREELAAYLLKPNREREHGVR
jgi:acyl-CoA dehydrogenase